MRQAVRAAIRPVVRWVLGRMSAIEEHYTDPAERWARLKAALRQLERRSR
jgi:hypothetical protein